MKEERHRAILDLVRERPVQTQRDLAQALAGKGFSATQATVSRDLQEMGLWRSSGGWAAAPAGLEELVLSVTEVEFMLVVRTPPGTANLVARAIDESSLEGVAGTLAGDDTILVVLQDRAAAKPLRRLLSA
ncbi:MAG: arginine repressor [Candidatus Dormibacteraceae bacterium]